MTNSDYITSLAQQIDWESLGADAAEMTGINPRQQVLTAIRLLRGKGSNFFGFDTNFFPLLDKFSTAAQRTEAVTKLEKAIKGDIFWPPHGNAFATLGAPALALAMTPERAMALAGAIEARQADWSNNIWQFGITNGAASLLRFLAPLPAVPDEALIPVIGWLCAIAPVEWRHSCGWNDRVLGVSGHNWYIHSLYGLWMGGALCGCFRSLQRFQSLAPEYLEREVALLFDEDGWSKEGNAGYHRFAFGEVLSFWLLARRHGIKFAPAFEARLRQIANATWRMQAPDGDPPIFGDGSPHADGDVARSAYMKETQILAARFGLAATKGALAALSPTPDPAFLPHEGEDLAPRYAALKAANAPLDTALPHSGLYAMRSSWRTDGDWMAVNAMPIGPVVTSHKHADLLNIEVCASGRRVLVDNWYGDITSDDGSYGQDPEIKNNPMKRRWRVGSSAHNVTTVDNEDIVPVEQIYRYGWNETPLVEEWISAPQYAWFSAVHEAYRRLKPAVVAVRRKIFYLRGAYWVVIDRFTADFSGEHTYTQHFFMPNATVVNNGAAVVTSGAGGNLLLMPIAGLTGDLALEPCPYPIGSYQNPDHITITTKGRDVVMAVLLVPFGDDTPPQASAAVRAVQGIDGALSPWVATAIAIETPGHNDLLLCQHLHQNQPWQCAGHSGSQRLYHSRLANHDQQGEIK